MLRTRFCELFDIEIPILQRMGAEAEDALRAY
jgi:hypothetical protein